MTVGLVATSVASADPVNAPGAASQTFVCGGVPVTLTVLPNRSAAAFTSSTSVGISVGVTVTDVATGEVPFSSLKPGFEVNALQTTTCTITLAGQEIAVAAFFTPATPAGT
ncbi:MAG: hypothetical protein M3292_04325 [Actinomycetota bacterium]|nr:hypothetical protein [Actinomycetota bacterium]